MCFTRPGEPLLAVHPTQLNAISMGVVPEFDDSIGTVLSLEENEVEVKGLAVRLYKAFYFKLCTRIATRMVRVVLLDVLVFTPLYAIVMLLHMTATAFHSRISFYTASISALVILLIAVSLLSSPLALELHVRVQ